MNKLLIGFVLILVLNCLVEATPAMKAIGMKALRSETFRAEGNCKKEGERCDSKNKCCQGFACNRWIFGLGVPGSVRCGKGRQ
ncbi:u16-Nephitoxin-Nsp1d_1 [Trichonephila clavata]|uniref:U16-Nephitoxin-Nsp1d_1 n=1 Tax=Trichonephila clavata TaxID=2740835 RepID=A0A8X6G5S2_TRICU|nr:u16-Nephitoxin-Nsp1d_1 [Trichonephila clavata]